MRGADCSTDPYLIRSLRNLHIKPRRRKIGPTLVTKLNVSKLAVSEMQKVLVAYMETNVMNLSYNGMIIRRVFVRKCTKHLLTLWCTQPGNIG